MRQLELANLCERLKPQSILEVGVFDGQSGKVMIKASGAARYVGFDLFEDATLENDALEFNIKPHLSLDEVMKRMKDACPDTPIELIRGNTRETLPAFVESNGNRPFDFAFIDGGHSVATIQSDWDCVKQLMHPNGIVIFDDFYTDRDVSSIGCNRVVHQLPYVLLPEVDPVVVKNVQYGDLQLAMVEMADVVRLGL